MNAYITHLDYYLPSGRLHFNDHIDFFNTNKEHFDTAQKFIDYSKNALGLESVAVETDKTLEEMVTSLLDISISKCIIVPNEIDYIIVAPDLDSQLPDFGSFVQKKYKMDNATLIRSSGDFCVNIDVSIGVASQILNKEKNKKILILAGSKLEVSLEERIVGGYGVMGDAAGIILMSGEANKGILKINQQNILFEPENGVNALQEGSAFVHLKAYIKCMKALNDLNNDCIEEIILHNANHLLMKEALTYVGLDTSKIDTINQKKYGHLGTADLILNLKTNLDNNHDNGRILTLNLGISGTYAATIFQKIN
jgi:3-oxoacyl-[acyl-carrier-protein] synthase III